MTGRDAEPRRRAAGGRGDGGGGSKHNNVDPDLSAPAPLVVRWKRKMKILKRWDL
ncbi:unnamed protein product [Linum tenue]|uniref:Uncharacterized protein n=1 Tax=Linum tenue TaxID=586396 RepID=A0AAV0H1Z0_9ROSI|nr:unnamed protein product [Linum tenue]